MKGLHRATLNLNPNVGDMGAVALVHALQDDLWIKGHQSIAHALNKSSTREDSVMLCLLLL